MQEELEIVANVIGLVLFEAFRAISTLQQKGLAFGDAGELLLEIAHFLDKNQRRKVA